MTNNKPVIIVCGLGRCGSSLLMQLLHAGGIPCIGEPPIFESDKCAITTQEPLWLSNQHGHALKVLLPERFKFIESEYYFLWVNRDKLEHAKSVMKFGLFFSRKNKLPSHNRFVKTLMKFHDNYDKDTENNLHHIKKYGRVFKFNFEEMIINPNSVILQLQSVLPFELNINKMHNIVKFRSTQCSADMNLEFDLIKEHEKNK